MFPIQFASRTMRDPRPKKIPAPQPGHRDRISQRKRDHIDPLTRARQIPGAGHSTQPPGGTHSGPRSRAGLLAYGFRINEPTGSPFQPSGCAFSACLASQLGDTRQRQWPIVQPAVPDHSGGSTVDLHHLPSCLAETRHLRSSNLQLSASHAVPVGTTSVAQPNADEATGTLNQ